MNREIKKFRVKFAWHGKLIERVGYGRNEGEARIDARQKQWARFCKKILGNDYERRNENK